jgi:hypothetical protein
MTEEVTDRRKDKRFRLPEGSMVAFRPGYSKLGRIIDIGAGGLGLIYIHSQELPKVYIHSQELPKVSSELDIFVAIRDFYLYHVPFETIWDFETDATRFSSLRKKRSGLKFGQLTQAQISGLEYFIENHTTGEI